MPLAAKHVGAFETCPACIESMPYDFTMRSLSPDTRKRIRDEALWAHAVAQFADQSGVDVDPLTRDDLELLVKAWARSNRVVQLDGELYAETGSHPSGFRTEPGPRSGSTYILWGIVGGIVTCLAILCAGIWRFFL